MNLEETIERTILVSKLQGEIDAYEFIIQRAKKRIEHCRRCIEQIENNTKEVSK